MRSAMLGALLLATLSSAACQTMKPVALEELGTIRPARVWVTRGDQSVVVVDGPLVLDRRLVGFVDGRYQVMPAADVTQVLMRRPAGGRTAAVIAAGAVGSATVAYLVSKGGAYRNPCDLASSECDNP